MVMAFTMHGQHIEPDEQSPVGPAQTQLATRRTLLQNVQLMTQDQDFGFQPESLEAERIKYAIRLPANQVLQSRIAYLLKRPVGRPPNEVRRYYANFTYQAATWRKPRRVIAKVEWHPGELYPRVGFIVTNMSRPAERVVAFYNERGTAEQWIKEGKGAIKWTRLSCRTFAANAVRLQLHALAYNLGNFLRTPATPEPIKDWRGIVRSASGGKAGTCITSETGTAGAGGAATPSIDRSTLPTAVCHRA